MSYEYVWVLVKPAGEVLLFGTEKLAIEYLEENPRRIEVSPKNYWLTLTNGSKYRLFLEKVRGSKGLI